MNKPTENIHVVNLIQAMLGSITPNMRAVFIACPSTEKLQLYFLLEHESVEDREEIDDIVFEFEALQGSWIDIEPIVLVDTRPLHELNIQGRMVYARKES